MLSKKGRLVDSQTKALRSKSAPQYQGTDAGGLEVAHFDSDSAAGAVVGEARDEMAIELDLHEWMSTENEITQSNYWNKNGCADLT